jgi:hypothetical protein
MSYLATLRIRCSGSETSLDCDALAVAGQTVMLASVAGPSSTIKALSALLQTKQAFDLWAGNRSYEKYPGTYHCHKCRLGYNTWHMLAIAEHNGLLLDNSDAALWRELQSDRYTTPLLRQWVPEIRRVLEGNELLRTCGGHGCQVGVLRLKDEELDAIVADGLREGRLEIN